MKIAVLSDIHDHTENLNRVIDKIVENQCQMIFSLGDYTSLRTFKMITRPGLPIFAVFGNLDQEQEKIEKWIKDSGKEIALRREMNRVRIDNRNLAITHFPEIAEKLLKSGMYDAVFFGHTHNPETKREETTLLVNPGALKEGSFGIYDSERNDFEIFKI